jgi:hypothetical protein
VSTQEWQCIKNTVPNFMAWPEVWIGCIVGSVSGVLLLETILNFIVR